VLAGRGGFGPCSTAFAGSRTTIAAITQVFPNVTFFPPCADPS
jgi:hypothetical protein